MKPKENEEEKQEYKIIIPIHNATRKSVEAHAKHIKERLNDKPTYYPEVYIRGHKKIIEEWQI